MFNFNGRRKKMTTFFLLVLCSLVTMISFQNCGQGNVAQSASTVGGNNGALGSPAPAPTPGSPAPTPTPGVPGVSCGVKTLSIMSASNGNSSNDKNTCVVTLPSSPVSASPVSAVVTGQGSYSAVCQANGQWAAPTASNCPLPAITPNQRATLCNTIFPTSNSAVVTGPLNLEINLVSGLASGSGDVGQAGNPNSSTVNPGIAGINRVVSTVTLPSAVAEKQITCAFTTTISCSVATDAAHPISINQAFSLDDTKTFYGTDVAASGAVGQTAIAQGATTLTPCNMSITDSTTAATYDHLFAIAARNNNNGFRCVKGSYYIKVSARTQVEAGGNGNQSSVSDANSQFIKVNYTDGCWKESRTSPTDLVRLAAAGSKVALSDTWAAALVPLDDSVSVLATGSVYMYQNVSGNWVFHSKVTLPAALSNDNTSDVAISGNNMVISSQKNNANTGVAYLFSFVGNAWTTNTNLKISPPNGQGKQLFGAALSFYGGVLAVGAPSYSNAGVTANDLSGMVYIYDCNSSCIYRYSIANTLYPGSAFGQSLSLSGGMLAIGAPMALNLGTLGDGYVDIYNVSSLASASLSLHIPAPSVNPVAVGDEPSGMRFGASVSLLGAQLAVGAPAKNTAAAAALNVGAVYYYSAYTATAKLITQATALGYFGKAVALNNKGLYIGFPGPSLTVAGAVRFYNNASLASASPGTTFTLFGLNRMNGDNFGSSLAATDNFLSVGASAKAYPNNYSGEAYTFNLP